MRAAERLARDERVMALFYGGRSYRDIAAAVGLRSPQSVGNIVSREIGRAGRHPRTEFARAVWLERSELLWQRQWPRAEAGDHRAAEICLRLLFDRVRFHGVTPS